MNRSTYSSHRRSLNSFTTIVVRIVASVTLVVCMACDKSSQSAPLDDEPPEEGMEMPEPEAGLVASQGLTKEQLKEVKDHFDQEAKASLRAADAAVTLQMMTMEVERDLKKLSAP